MNLAVTKFNGQSGSGIYLLDLNHAGANLETPFPLSLGFHVEVSFRLPGTAMEFQMSGRIMWKQQLTVPSGRYRLGVQFYVPRWDLDNLLQTIVPTRGMLGASMKSPPVSPREPET